MANINMKHYHFLKNWEIISRRDPGETLTASSLINGSGRTTISELMKNLRKIEHFVKSIKAKSRRNP